MCLRAVVEVGGFGVVTAGGLLDSAGLVKMFFVVLIYTLPTGTRFLHASCFVRNARCHRRLGPTLAPAGNCFGLPIINTIGTAIKSASLKCRSVVSVVSSKSSFCAGPSFVGQLGSGGGLGIGFDARVLSTN